MKRALEFIQQRRGGLLFVAFLAAAMSATGCAASGAYGHGTYAGYYEYGYGGFEDFEVLAYYGEWVYIPPFGRVWRPFVRFGWRPFVYGHWAWSRFGWTWVSYEPFGWVVYHYGYWNFDPGWGWYWIPGYEWAPARVRWITFGRYVAWAPLPPPGVTWPEPWYAGDDDDWFRPHRHGHHRSRVRVNVWVAVDLDHFTREDVGRYAVERLPSKPRYGYTSVYRVQRAPDVHYVEQATRSRVQRLDFRTETVRVGSKTIQKMTLPEYERRKVERYRPEVEKRILQRRVEPKNRSRSESKPRSRGKSSAKSSKDRERRYDLPRIPARPKYKKRERSS